MEHEPVVTAEQIADYERDGAIVIRNVLDSEMLDLLTRGVEEAYALQSEPSSRLKPKGEGETVVRDYVSPDSPALTALMSRGVIGRIGAALMRSPSAHLILDQIFYKKGGEIVPTPWHQDTPFLRVRGQALIRLWFPCDFSPKDLTVQVVRGSHRWNVVYGTGVTVEGGMAAGKGDRPLIGDAQAPPPPDVRSHRDSFDIMSWDVAPGDVLAFQGNMLHGTEGRTTPAGPRRAFAVLMGGPDLAFHQPTGVAFPSPGRKRGLRVRDDIPEGAPIGNYEDAFPNCSRETLLA
jgi:ectoine hydroxylase-related dioxygenase (phytanoyl-CoA dioxygenase family)